MKPGTDLLDDPVEWGRQLILTEDHDPLYVGLARWDVRGSRLRRYLLAYWCCYSVGASYHLSLSSGTRFWEELEKAARNVEPSPLGERWPRAHERRHWRGEKCVESVLWLRGQYRHPEEAVLDIEHHARTLREVEGVVTAWPQFGPWIAFKAADMVERVLGHPVAFPDNLLSLYKDPKEGAAMAAEIMESTPAGVLGEMLSEYAAIEAPGRPGRKVNIQEVETVLCKWKSARKGNYWIGLDTRDHRAELERWNARDLLSAYPTTPD